MKKIIVIHGPNLNLLGEREPGVYGNDSFDSINAEIAEKAIKRGTGARGLRAIIEGIMGDVMYEIPDKA